jgi:hypothetical protein
VRMMIPDFMAVLLFARLVVLQACVVTRAVLFAGQVMCILIFHRLQLWLLSWICVDVTKQL